MKRINYCTIIGMHSGKDVLVCSTMITGTEGLSVLLLLHEEVDEQD